MSEIDLIPTAYRRSLVQRTWLARLALLLFCVAIALGAGKLGLVWAVHASERSLLELERVGQLAIEQRTRLDRLVGERADIALRLSVLDELRSGIVARQMFVVIDRALDGSIWFSSWKFQRAEELVESDPETVKTGFFIVVPNQARDKPEQAWRLRAHMEIRARALDHSSLADFVRRLVEQPEIEEVRVLATRIRRVASTQLVDFELAVVVNSRA